MAKITLAQIQEALQGTGWVCNDTKYINLKTVMSFTCPEGHLVEQTWDKMRNKRFCPVCANNAKKKVVNIAAAPKGKAYRIIALDQSSHKTGYAIYDGLTLVSYGVYESTKASPMDRLKAACDWLDSMIANWKPDEIGFEEPQYNPGGGDDKDKIRAHDTFKLLAQIMGALMITAMRAKVKVSTVLIPTWRHHCGVKGRYRADQKRSAQLLVKQWHDILVSDDESDAICMGKYYADKHNTNKPVIGDDSWF